MAQSKLILLAESDVVNERVARRQLENLGYHVASVSNGPEAVAALGGTAYDLVLMDCAMPEMDGLSTTREIRRREGTIKHTTIVAMTAHGLKGDRENCLAAGMDDYISTPLRPSDLENLLERIFAGPNDLSQSEAEAETLPPPVDLEHINEAMGEDTSEILDLYVTGTTQDLAKLAKAIQTNNVEEVDQIAHNCAGTSATCGMVAIVPMFRALEKAGREGNLDKASEYLDEAKRQFERIRLFLKAEFLIP